MPLKRSEKKALREKVRKYCAELIRESRIPEELYSGDDTEVLLILRREFESVANRIDHVFNNTESSGDA